MNLLDALFKYRTVRKVESVPLSAELIRAVEMLPPGNALRLVRKDGQDITMMHYDDWVHILALAGMQSVDKPNDAGETPV